MANRNKLLMVMVLLMAVLFFMPSRLLLAAGSLDPDKDSSLTMTLKASDEDETIAVGAEVTIYMVAEGKYVSGGIKFELTDDYKSSGLDVEGKITQSMIDDLADYTVENDIAGTVSAKSDDKGVVTFDGLKSGLYLIMATDLPEGFTSFVPFLYFLPYFSTDLDSWVYDGEAEPKIDYLEPVDVKVKKVWNDDGNDRPSYVSIRLSNEDGDYDTVKLNDDNDWKYTWKGLDASKDWEVTEITVPDGYKATYSSDGFSFTVTNTRKLIQTGQTNWPVPVLIFAGAFLVSAGIIVRVTGRKKHEG